VTRLFSQAAEERNRDELHPLGLDLVRTIARLCKRRDSPCRRQAKLGRKIVGFKTRSVRSRSGSPSRRRSDLRHGIPTQPAAHFSPEPTIVSPFCPFCKADNGIGDSQREKRWRIDSLRRHLRTQHLKRRSAFKCPYADCTAILADGGHFADHAGRQHGLHLPAAALPEGRRR
jgi:hypothetical protein